LQASKAGVMSAIRRVPNVESAGYGKYQIAATAPAGPPQESSAEAITRQSAANQEAYRQGFNAPRGTASIYPEGSLLRTSWDQGHQDARKRG
jgi:hypothetical protein